MSVDTIVTAALIAGNVLGVFYLLRRFEKKIDKKAAQVKNSKEGQMVVEIIEALHTTVKSKEGAALLKELEATVKEVRLFIQRISVKPVEDEEDEEPVLPSLRDTHG